MKPPSVAEQIEEIAEALTNLVTHGGSELANLERGPKEAEQSILYIEGLMLALQNAVSGYYSAKNVELAPKVTPKFRLIGGDE